MAHRGLDGLSDNGNPHTLKLDIGEKIVELPDNSYVRDADIMRDGMDLLLQGPDGAIIIEGYFGAETAPNLVAPDGVMLTPELVHSFVQSNGQFASSGSMNDVSPVGEVHEVSGDATVTRTDDSVDDVQIGTRIFQGDVVETNADGAVNIVFVDETSFAVSEDARLAIDEFVFDPSTNSGAQNFSVLKGVFVFTSGLIGREDPDDVEIDTPIGSIGIRGTIIAGDVDAGEITVVEGAIVVRDFNGNEMTLANQFETARMDPTAGTIENIGEMSANDVGTRFSSVSNVAPSLFSSINDAAQEGVAENVNPDGSVDQDSDGDVDSTINAETDGQAEENAADDAPVGEEVIDQPAPTGDTTTNFNTTEFGDSSDGFSDDTGQTAPAPAGAQPAPATQAAPPPADARSPTGTAPQQNQNTTTDPTVLNGGTTNPANAAPTHVNHTAVESFVSMEGLTWKYNFDHDFNGTNAGETLIYQLDDATITNLNSLTNDYGGGNPDVLSNANGTGVDGSESSVGWSFDTSAGEIILFHHDNFENDVDISYDITVRAIDSAGNESGWETYTVNALDADTANYGGTTLNSITGATLSATNANNGIIFGPANAADNNIYHAGLGDDNVTITMGNDNTIYLGDGDNTASIQSGNTGNTIVGGRSNDVFSIDDLQNTVKGMGGEDNFILDLDQVGLLSDLQTDNNPNIQIEGGENSFRALDVLGNHGVTNFLGFVNDGITETSRGDSVTFTSANDIDIDFTAIDDGYIKGIERLDFENGGENVVTLDYTSVIQMTEGNNTLIINMDGNDTLTFMAEGHTFTKVTDDMQLDDSASGAAAELNNYDVFTDGNVTLLVHDNGVNVAGLPA